MQNIGVLCGLSKAQYFYTFDLVSAFYGHAISVCLRNIVNGITQCRVLQNIGPLFRDSLFYFRARLDLNLREGSAPHRTRTSRRCPALGLGSMQPPAL